MKNILLLDDEPSVMKLMRLMLKPYSLIEATTAEEALMLFIVRDHQVDLLVADVSLPAFSGIQVALLLRSKLPTLPVILTSGYPASGWNSQDTANLNRLNRDGLTILQKPFAAQTLLDAVANSFGAQASGTMTA